jgi:hypothetical protein
MKAVCCVEARCLVKLSGAVTDCVNINGSKFIFMKISAQLLALPFVPLIFRRAKNLETNRPCWCLIRDESAPGLYAD